jgi:hypothetical protein
MLDDIYTIGSETELGGEITLAFSYAWSFSIYRCSDMAHQRPDNFGRPYYNVNLS